MLCSYWTTKPTRSANDLVIDMEELNQARADMVDKDIKVALGTAEKFAPDCYDKLKQYYITHGHFPKTTYDCQGCYQLLPQLSLDEKQYRTPQQIAQGVQLQHLEFTDHEGGEFGPESSFHWAVSISKERFMK